MKTLEDLKKEYDGYEAKSTFIPSAEELSTFLEIGIDDFEEDLAGLRKEMIIDKKQKSGAIIRNLFFFMFGEEDLEFYDQDIMLVQKEISLALEFRQYFREIQTIILPENYKELIRLTDFTTDHYNENLNYLESKRDSLELAQRGITSFNPKYDDSRGAFGEFIQEKIEEFTPKKQVEKAKRM